MFSAEGADGLGESAGEVEGCEANAVQSASHMPRAATAGIVSQNRIEHVEATVLDVPAAAQMLEQERGIGLGSRQAGDGVGRAAASLALLDGVTFQADELFRAGPVEVLLVDGRRGRGHGARFETTAILLHGRSGLLLSQCFTLLVGGKSFVESRSLARCHAGVAVDSL